MGRKIVLTGVEFTDTDLPRLTEIDPIESDGSLVLIEPAHPITAWSAGVPSDGATIPNILKATLTTDDLTYETGGNINDNTHGKMERSTLGGLHGIVSQANALTVGDGVAFRGATALRDYFNAHDDHDYFISIWDRVTRVSTSTGITNDVFSYPIYSDAASIARGLAGASDYRWLSTTGGGAIGASQALGNISGPRRAYAYVTAYLEPTTQGLFCGPVWGAAEDTLSEAHIATRNQKYGSFVFYRLYIEDLTVSGRSYSAVNVLDAALYTTEVLTAGGRYYGDTVPTDPATIP